MKAIIFTDLDGSLLNHEDYSFAGARFSLKRIQENGIPLIIATSKTRAEVEPLQKQLGINAPFIVENGGGIFFPHGYGDLIIEGGERQEDYTVRRLGVPYPIVRGFLERLRERFKIRGFGDLTPAEISELTGLSQDQAELSGKRDFTEPFLLEEPRDIDPISALAAEAGFKVTRGGRFLHLIGKDQDKGAAVRITREVFRINLGQDVIAIGLGDSENDLPMLREVDIPVLIPHPERGYLDVSLPGMILAKEPGSRGWNEVVELLLDRLSATTGELRGQYT
ncbi:MAG: HAD-IIB family hydrolase [Pseudomonadota bacterium]|nr:HAD-IIB family hydrolase [Pseudomonadota bacterium]MBU4121802.1 HAD-IIB family hydrolase [Pseudomonadota bacterium]